MTPQPREEVAAVWLFDYRGDDAHAWYEKLTECAKAHARQFVTLVMVAPEAGAA